MLVKRDLRAWRHLSNRYMDLHIRTGKYGSLELDPLRVLGMGTRRKQEQSRKKKSRCQFGFHHFLRFLDVLDCTVVTSAGGPAPDLPVRVGVAGVGPVLPVDFAYSDRWVVV